MDLKKRVVESIERKIELKNEGLIDLKFDYKSWGQSKNNYYSSIYSNCYYCGDVCDENYYSKHIPSFKIYNDQNNDFCNVPMDIFKEHFITREEIREERINKILK
jgi:hypothetical protein